MWRLLEKTQEDMTEDFPQPPQITPAVETVENKSQYEQCIVYLNSISDTVHKKLAKHPEELIRFFDRRSEDHATGTADYPDLLARKVGRDGDDAVFHWSALEAPGEFLSDENNKDACAETISYTYDLLQARPDRLTVQGIYVDDKGFRLIVSNACGASSTKHLEWEPRSSHLLLCAWIGRLYQPAVDPSITTNFEGDKLPTFTITLPGDAGVYQDCTIRYAGGAFGRRTIILDCPGEPNIVIKEQYIKTSRRLQEGPNLTKIHKQGVFPGVVQLGWHGPVKSGEDELVVRWKDPKTGKISEKMRTRMVLLDRGESIMDAKTVRETLVAMYDLLESD